jgi:hypothetical protein
MPLRERLRELAAALRDGGATAFAELAEAAAAADDEQLKAFLTSNDLWGGSGSIADQAGISKGDRSPERKTIEATLVALGQEQLKIGMANMRTEMWVGAFQEWKQSGI